MLEKFRAQAREALNKRIRQIEEVVLQTEQRQERIVRIKDRIKFKEALGVDSDSDGPKEQKKPEVNGNMRDYTRIKAQY